ncbi:HipA N-terminal domain-containing protein, partial [Empedobacter sp.]
MRIAQILYKGERAGVLTQLDNGRFHFIYNEDWLNDDSKPSISLTLPKN